MSNRENPELVIYRLLFRSILASNGKERVSNDSVDHAIVLIEELIRSAKRNVDIYCHQLSRDVWSDAGVKSAVAEAMLRGVHFRVVVQTKDDEEVAYSPFACVRSDVRRYFNNQLRANFLVVDRKAFRFEPDYAVRKGFAYANNEAISRNLVNAFESIYQVAG